MKKKMKINASKQNQTGNLLINASLKLKVNALWEKNRAIILTSLLRPNSAAIFQKKIVAQKETIADFFINSLNKDVFIFKKDFVKMETNVGLNISRMNSIKFD